LLKENDIITSQFIFYATHVDLDCQEASIGMAIVSLQAE
jgi:hypothetical protein